MSKQDEKKGGNPVKMPIWNFVKKVYDYKSENLILVELAISHLKSHPRRHGSCKTVAGIPGAIHLPNQI